MSEKVKLTIDGNEVEIEKGSTGLKEFTATWKLHNYNIDTGLNYYYS